ncbi:hypothetical protein [Virgibacillus oceani]|uniref:Lipoprotein n=1 Tax=Virgibacillus oceani TaxID=1479511 RepID=A0A917H818_9BACI|nr:hypothetical protein [Virgibacillus oceani]GGG70493.1 hypothetical protein GCM10011398_13270 [Virgibacillus oceani]
MFKRVSLLFLLLLLLAACSKDDPVIVKKGTKAADPNEEPELVEQKNKEDIDQFIEFALPDEKVMINLEMVPILNEYLYAMKDQEIAIEQMKMLKIDAIERDIYLLEFSCQKELCSYLLLDQSKENQAFLVADLAKAIQTKLSPDHSKILLQFNRETFLPVPLSDLVVIDLKNWQPVSLVNETNESKLLHFSWPIVTAEWLDDHTLTARIPTVTEPSANLLKNWQETGSKTTSIQFSIQQNE